MKAAVLRNYDQQLSGPESGSFEEIPDPTIDKDTDVIVRIGGAGVCRTDLHVVEGLWRSRVHIDLPNVMGHGTPDGWKRLARMSEVLSVAIR